MIITSQEIDDFFDNLMSEVTENLNNFFVTSDDNFFLYENLNITDVYIKNIEDNFKKIKEFQKKYDDNYYKFKSSSAKYTANISKNIGNILGRKTEFLIREDRQINAALICGLDYSIFLNQMVNTFLNKSLNIPQISDESIRNVTIIFTSAAIKELESRELISILLHEFGHLYQNPSFFETYFRPILEFFRNILFRIFATAGIGAGWLLAGIPFVWQYIIAAMAIYSVLSFVISKSISTLNHRIEYKSDKFVVDCGYGKEFISVLEKTKKYERQKPSEFLSKLKEFFKKILLSKYETHPNIDKRIESMLIEMKKEMVKLTPSLSQDVVINKLSSLNLNPKVLLSQSLRQKI